MAATRIVSIVGRKNAGKTTLVVALASEFVRKGRRVMTIKHATHPVEVDREGTDSYRHFHEGKAERVLIAAPDRRTIFERSPDATDPLTLARRYFDGADIVLVEGFSAAPLPKIEVFRRAVVPPTTLYDAQGDHTDDWVAIVTDDEKYEASCPVLHFRDTMWLQLLATIAWDRAKVL
ncbi:MAG: molybdopterin-guanine dinucleotide biosynthesis protein B [Gemmatimonadales bacterium]